jgi:hypothetical protein
MAEKIEQLPIDSDLTGVYWVSSSESRRKVVAAAPTANDDGRRVLIVEWPDGFGARWIGEGFPGSLIRVTPEPQHEPDYSHVDVAGVGKVEVRNACAYADKADIRGVMFLDGDTVILAEAGGTAKTSDLWDELLPRRAPTDPKIIQAIAVYFAGKNPVAATPHPDIAAAKVFVGGYGGSTGSAFGRVIAALIALHERELAEILKTEAEPR